MDHLAKVSPARLRRLLPMLGVVRVEPFDGESGLTGLPLSVHRALHRDDTFTAGVAVDAGAAWNRAALRACTRLSRRWIGRHTAADPTSGGLLDAVADDDSELGVVLQSLRRAGWQVVMRRVTSSGRMKTVSCDAYCPDTAVSHRGFGVAGALEAAALDALLEAVAASVETVWTQRPRSHG